MMKSSYSFSFGNLEEGDYSLEIKAYDSWGLESAPLEKSFTVGGANTTIWVTDAAGSKTIGGSDINWTANTTGKPRSQQFDLSDGSKLTVVQLEHKDFKGAWSFRTQRFSKNTAVASAATDITFEVNIGDAKYGETLSDLDGKSYTNQLGLSGLYLDAVADATVSIDYDNRSVRFGLFLDERKAQAVSNGKSGYPYVCFIPECATGWMAQPWNFVPVPIHSSQNYTWLWFNVSGDFATLNYDQPNKQYLPGTSSGANLIIGITCAVCASATPAASDINTDYDVIYQANPNKVNTNGGFTLTRK